MKFPHELSWKCVTLLCASAVVAITLNFPETAHSASPITITLKSSKATYKPGENVDIQATTTPVRTGETLTCTIWQANTRSFTVSTKTDSSGIARFSISVPKTDFRGYLAVISNENSTAQSSIAFDIASNTNRFIRYGFLSNFGPMSQTEQKNIINTLNRFHINSLQFYDWQDAHQAPLPFDSAGKPLPSWLDIAKRPTSLSTVSNYITLAHAAGMTAMNYNLIMGAYAGASGINKQWGLYKDPLHATQDYHPLPASWESDLYLLNPGNPSWESVLTNQMKRVQTQLKFDGWQVDQLGDRGWVYDYSGKQVNLPNGYAQFLRLAKMQLGYTIAMNAVDQYAQAQILGGHATSFAYSELWSEHETFGSLKQVIDENNAFYGSQIPTVLAAYMNYGRADNQGVFNASSVLQTDAVIMASGGDHLELGEHMLGKEYFPNSNLAMSTNLTTKLMPYYDFMTAYENLLRDGAIPKNVTLSFSNGPNLMTGSNPTMNSVWSFAKSKGTSTILQFINFIGKNSDSWRDTNGTASPATPQGAIKVLLADSTPIKSIQIASPDFASIAPTSLPFTQTGSAVTFTMPSLTYWNMVVINH